MLQAAGASLSHLVSVQIYIVDVAYWPDRQSGLFNADEGVNPRIDELTFRNERTSRIIVTSR